MEKIYDWSDVAAAAAAAAAIAGMLFGAIGGHCGASDGYDCAVVVRAAALDPVAASAGSFEKLHRLGHCREVAARVTVLPELAAFEPHKQWRSAEERQRCGAWGAQDSTP